MKAVVQRVKNCRLSVDGALVSEIDYGLAVYLGVECGDLKEQAEYMAKKIANLRIFNNDKKRMNYSVLDIGAQVLIIPQFTLCADTTGGNRPSFVFAEEPKRALEMFNYVTEQLILQNVKVKTGIFGAEMDIEQYNIGPVTILLQS